MKKQDLKVGYLVETRDGTLSMVMPSQKGIVLIRRNGYHRQLNLYNEDLTYKLFNKAKDMVKVWGYSHYSNKVLEFDITDRELLWERKELPTLTEDEKTILRNVDEKFKYIARDKDNELWLYSGKPHNEISFGDYWTSFHEKRNLPFDKLFQFIKWEDDEPCNIKELLNQ